MKPTSTNQEPFPVLSVADGSVYQKIELPRVRTFRNRHGDSAAWYRARKKGWWLTDPIIIGKQKMHVYGVLSRRTWKSGFRSIEITASSVTIAYSPNKAGQT